MISVYPRATIRISLKLAKDIYKISQIHLDSFLISKYKLYQAIKL
jgi:hypothetical protein